MKKILITGGTGMLGTYVSKRLENSDYEIIYADRQHFNLSNPANLYAKVIEIKPDIILHLAAETDVDLCERDPVSGGINNHLATESIARAANICGAWMLYISSSNVFGAEGKFLYNELDLPNPVNYYGRSKLFGELSIRTYCPQNHLIIRAGWMIGGGPQLDHKFVGKVVKQIRDGASVLKAVSDRMGSITSASLLSEFIIWAINLRQTGTIHFASSGLVSRFDIADRIGQLLSFSGTIEPVMSAQFPLSAPRPFSEGIESIYLSTLKDAPKPQFWRKDLEDYVNTFKQL